MSDVKTIYIEDKITKEQVFEFVNSYGGYIMDLDDTTQGVIEKKNAVIWVYFCNDLKFFSNEISQVITDYEITVNAVIQIELNSSNSAGKIALDFSRKFIKQCGKSILSDCFGKYYTLNDLMNTKCDKFGTWN